MAKSARGNAFYGDDSEQNAGAGYKGNDVDFSQRYAQSEADEYMEQAERTTRQMERMGIRLGAAREKFVADMAKQFRGGPATPAQPQEPDEAPFSNEKFFSDPKELKKAGRAVRPPKL